MRNHAKAIRSAVWSLEFMGANLRTEGERGVHAMETFARKLVFDAGGGHGGIVVRSLGKRYARK